MLKHLLSNFWENNFKINGLNLSQNYKINYIEEVNLNFLNDSKKENKILLKKNKENYKLFGKISKNRL